MQACFVMCMGNTKTSCIKVVCSSLSLCVCVCIYLGDFLMCMRVVSFLFGVPTSQDGHVYGSYLGPIVGLTQPGPDPQPNLLEARFVPQP